LKALATVGAVAVTVRSSEAVLPVPPLVEVTLPVVLDLRPGEAPVTVTSKVHVPLAAIVAALRAMVLGRWW